MPSGDVSGEQSLLPWFDPALTYRTLGVKRCWTATLQSGGLAPSNSKETLCWHFWASVCVTAQRWTIGGTCLFELYMSWLIGCFLFSHDDFKYCLSMFTGCEVSPDVNISSGKFSIKLFVPSPDGMSEIWIRADTVSAGLSGLRKH